MSTEVTHFVWLVIVYLSYLNLKVLFFKKNIHKSIKLNIMEYQIPYKPKEGQPKMSKQLSLVIATNVKLPM